MSLESVAIVLHHSRAKGTAKIVLIGIANHDGDGGAWPAIDTLAAYANANRATVQRAIASLERLGEVSRAIQLGGTLDTAAHDRPNRYDVLLKCPPTCDRSKHHYLVCPACGKRLKTVHRALALHPYCAPAQGGRVFENAAPVERPVEGAAFSKTRPELKQPPENVDLLKKGLNRARGAQSKIDAYGDDQTTASAAAGWAQAPEYCPARLIPTPHAYGVLSGRCIDCHSLDPAHQLETDGAA